MKKILPVIFCLTVIFSSHCFAEGGNEQYGSSKLTSKNEFPKIFRPVGNFFKRLFGKKRKNPDENYYASVKDITLSRTEIKTNCSNGNTSCSDKIQTIEVATEAPNPGNDFYFYSYKVSGGKIVGQGSKVIWDLSGVKPGTYTITAAVDNGCNFCGKTITKEVKVIECPDCQ